MILGGTKTSHQISDFLLYIPFSKLVSMEPFKNKFFMQEKIVFMQRDLWQV